MGLFKDLSVDLLSPILSHLDERRDWYSCTLVNRLFNDVATPYLYRTLDSRTTTYHPSSTLLLRPHLARFVRHVTETAGTTHRMLASSPEITKNVIAALALCVNLRSMTWIDDNHPKIDPIFLNFVDVLRDLPIRELTIRTHSNPGQEVWSRLVTMTGLQKVSLSCTEIPSQVLQKWFKVLSPHLTQLELKLCTDVESVVQSLSRLSRLQDLRLKGVRASVIPIIIGFLPNLQSLDIEYNPTKSASYDIQDDMPSLRQPNSLSGRVASPVLRHVTVRTTWPGSVGSCYFWKWILDLVPHPGLETFCLCTMNADAVIPSTFMLDLATKHRSTFKRVMVGACHLTLADIQFLCSRVPSLEALECSLSSPDMACIVRALTGAHDLQELKLRVRCAPANFHFTLCDATKLMLHDPNSKLRWITVNNVLYSGRWVLKHTKGSSQLRFQVFEDVLKGNWLV